MFKLRQLPKKSVIYHWALIIKTAWDKKFS